jgi:hypothetical protein
MWGQVLRNVLRKKLSSLAQSQVADDTLVPDDILGELTKLMGADLAIHASPSLPSSSLMPLPVLEIKADNPAWHIEIYHSVRGGGHYDFTYGDENLDTAHNQRYMPEADEWGRRIPTADALLFSATHILGVNEQEEAIKRIVAQKYQQMIQAQKQADKENLEPENLDSLFVVKKGSAPVLAPAKVEPPLHTPSLVLRATPAKTRGEASPQDTSAKSGAKTYQFHDSEFIRLLELKLKKVDWEYTILSDFKMQLVSKANASKTISIEQQQDAMVFTGTNDCHADLVDAVTAYEQTVTQRQQTLSFEINAHDQEEAIQFMANLSQNGFDIDKISEISCQNSPVPKEKMDEFVKDLIEKAKKRPKSPASRH